jgi:hypothetical protein
METKCGYRKRTCARSSNEAETSLPIKSAADSSVPRLRGYYSSQVLTRRSRVGIVGPCLSVSNSLLRRQAIELLSLCTILTPWWRRIQWCNSPTQRAPPPTFRLFRLFGPPSPSRSRRASPLALRHGPRGAAKGSGLCGGPGGGFRPPSALSPSGAAIRATLPGMGALGSGVERVLGLNSAAYA